MAAREESTATLGSRVLLFVEVTDRHRESEIHNVPSNIWLLLVWFSLRWHTQALSVVEVTSHCHDPFSPSYLPHWEAFSTFPIIAEFCDFSVLILILCRFKRVWPEAEALQAQVHEHIRQLQVLLSQRIHAYARWVLLKYVKNPNCVLSALGLLSDMLW